MYDLKKRCRVCDSSNFELIHTLKFKTLYDTKLPNSYEILLCHDCGFVYAYTTAIQKDYDQFYRDNNIYENSASYSDIKKYELTFDELRKYWGVEKSILDIGFANGELLKMFEGDGYKNLYGLDTSEECVKNLNEYGIDACQGSLLNHKIDRKFNYILLSHVLEHILDIRQAIKNLYDLLETDGELYIEVPNMLEYIENSAMPFNFFDIEHINHFSRGSLTQLVTKNKFDIVASGEKKWFIGNGMYYPAVWVLCRKSTEVKTVIRDYIKEYTKNCLTKNYPEIKKLIKSQEELIVWGTGSFAQRLYMMANLDQCNIKMYVDNSSVKIGRTFADKTIYSPKDIKENIPILILSVYGVEEIKQQIKEMGLQNKIIIL